MYILYFELLYVHVKLSENVNTDKMNCIDCGAQKLQKSKVFSKLKVPNTVLEYVLG